MSEETRKLRAKKYGTLANHPVSTFQLNTMFGLDKKVWRSLYSHISMFVLCVLGLCFVLCVLDLCFVS